MAIRMKITLIIIFIASLSCYAQENYNYWALEQSTPDWALKVFKTSNLADTLKLSNFINPFYFEEDFNGDSNRDIAILVEHIRTNKRGILIIHSKTLDLYLIGANTQFEGVDDYSWVEIWNVYRSSIAHELTYKEDGDIDGTRNIMVHNPCLEIIKLEASSSLIYWDGKRYRHAQMTE